MKMLITLPMMNKFAVLPMQLQNRLHQIHYWYPVARCSRCSWLQFANQCFIIWRWKPVLSCRKGNPPPPLCQPVQRIMLAVRKHDICYCCSPGCARMQNFNEGAKSLITKQEWTAHSLPYVSCERCWMGFSLHCRCLVYPSYIITVSLEYLTMPLAFVPQCLGAHRSHCCVNDVKFPSLKYSFLLASLKPNTLTEVETLSFIAARIKFKSLMLAYKVVSSFVSTYLNAL